MGHRLSSYACMCEGLGEGGVCLFVPMNGGQRSIYDGFLTLSSPHFPGQFLTESRADLAAVTGWEAPETHLCLGSSCKMLHMGFSMDSEARTQVLLLVW